MKSIKALKLQTQRKSVADGRKEKNAKRSIMHSKSNSLSHKNLKTRVKCRASKRLLKKMQLNEESKKIECINDVQNFNTELISPVSKQLESKIVRQNDYCSGGNSHPIESSVYENSSPMVYQYQKSVKVVKKREQALRRKVKILEDIVDQQKKTINYWKVKYHRSVKSKESTPEKNVKQIMKKVIVQ